MLGYSQDGKLGKASRTTTHKKMSRTSTFSMYKSHDRNLSQGSSPMKILDQKSMAGYCNPYLGGYSKVGSDFRPRKALKEERISPQKFNIFTCNDIMLKEKLL